MPNATPAVISVKVIMGLSYKEQRIDINKMMPKNPKIIPPAISNMLFLLNS